MAERTTLRIPDMLRYAAQEVAEENIGGWGNLMNDAAERIEKLEKEIIRLKRSCGEI